MPLNLCFDIFMWLSHHCFLCISHTVQCNLDSTRGSVCVSRCSEGDRGIGTWKQGQNRKSLCGLGQVLHHGHGSRNSYAYIHFKNKSRDWHSQKDIESCGKTWYIRIELWRQTHLYVPKLYWKKWFRHK